MFDRVPQFWQGVLASLLATIMAGIGVRLFRMFSARARESSRRNEENLKKLRLRITSADSVLGGEGYFVALFRLLRYLFVEEWCQATVSPFPQRGENRDTVVWHHFFGLRMGSESRTALRGVEFHRPTCSGNRPTAAARKNA